MNSNERLHLTRHIGSSNMTKALTWWEEKPQDSQLQNPVNMLLKPPLKMSINIATLNLCQGLQSKKNLSFKVLSNTCDMSC